MSTTIIIPKQLTSEKQRFIKIRPRQKIPLEKSWQKDNNYPHDNESLQKHLTSTGNYGVATGHNNLVVIDFDDAQVQEAALRLFPKTFSVKTGSGLLHLYFQTNHLESYKIINHENNKTLVDIQGKGKQVIGPGSIHPNGNTYEVVVDEPIEVINYDRVKQIFSQIVNFNDLPNKWREEIYDTREHHGGRTGDLVSEVKQRVTCNDVLRDKGYSHGPSIKCPIHGDKHASAGTFDNGAAFNCFSGCGGGDVFWLYQKLHHCDFKTALEELAEKTGVVKDTIKKQEEEKVLGVTADFDEVKVQAITKAKTEPRKCTEIIAQYIKNNHYIKTTRHDKGEEVWFYKEGIYEPEGTSIIQEVARKLLGELYTTHLRNEIIIKIKADTFIKSDVFFEQQNKTPYVVPVKNGLLNIRTRELARFTPKKYYFNKLNAEYRPGADCPFFIDFLLQVLGTSEKIDTVQEWYGYCLVKNYKYEKSLMFYGEQGRNGKSKLLDVLQELLGSENYTNISLKAIENSNNKFVLGNLRNKFVNISAEISNEALNNEGNFKGLTGGDSFTVDQKFKNSVTFKNYAKMMFSANILPIPKDTSDAFWSRWILVKFENRFLKEKDIKDLNEEQKKNVFPQKNDLMKDLTTPEELSGVLNWCLDGLERLEKNDDFTLKDSLRETKQAWLRNANNALTFIDEIVSTDYDSYITKKDFKGAYVTWCKHQGIKPVTDRTINTTMSDMGVTSTRKTIVNEDGQSQFLNVWDGIKFKTSIVAGRSTLR